MSDINLDIDLTYDDLCVFVVRRKPMWVKRLDRCFRHFEIRCSLLVGFLWLKAREREWARAEFLPPSKLGVLAQLDPEVARRFPETR